MAKTSLARRSVAPRRTSSRGGALKLVRAKQAMQATRARIRRDAAADSAMFIGAACAAALGYAEKQGYELPRVAGLEPTLVLGVGAGVLGPKLVKGKAGDMLRQFGAASLTVAAFKIGSGQPIIAGDEEEVGSGGWESV